MTLNFCHCFFHYLIKPLVCNGGTLLQRSIIILIFSTRLCIVIVSMASLYTYRLVNPLPKPILLIWQCKYCNFFNNDMDAGCAGCGEYATDATMDDHTAAEYGHHSRHTPLHSVPDGQYCSYCGDGPYSGVHSQCGKCGRLL